MSRVVRRRVVIHGRVQGVGFRWFVHDAADAAGVVGWVRNRPAGSVEAELEGPPAAIDDVIGLLRVGPPGARVDRVDVEESGLQGDTAFRILHT
ncbi:acylphosphatase [Agromyces seonyuensis]|uniref:Acylphosphatase n=1 Tax=Agromyces seonyuensis TaxID=2662446 RepID=A0A6I4NYL6_9MICO|nr:acylphosphatase [Agromyces seonyuensis]MWB99368.1 acylphosphatase [Agromyces seonyuensis]